MNMTETITMHRPDIDPDGAQGTEFAEPALKLNVGSPAPRAGLRLSVRPDTAAPARREDLTLGRVREGIATPAVPAGRRSRADAWSFPGLRLRALRAKSYAGVARSHGDDADLGERIALERPFGMPQFVNAATLKAMLGAGTSDVLFRLVGRHWEICPDSFVVDLDNKTVVFKLGQVQIYS
jgi:hypothetical protein